MVILVLYFHLGVIVGCSLMVWWVNGRLAVLWGKDWTNNTIPPCVNLPLIGNYWWMIVWLRIMFRGVGGLTSLAECLSKWFHIGHSVPFSFFFNPIEQIGNQALFNLTVTLNTNCSSWNQAGNTFYIFILDLPMIHGMFFIATICWQNCSALKSLWTMIATILWGLRRAPRISVREAII